MPANLTIIWNGRCKAHIYRVCIDKLYNFNTIINCFRIGTLIQMNVLTRPKTISHQRHTVFDVASLILKYVLQRSGLFFFFCFMFHLGRGMYVLYRYIYLQQRNYFFFCFIVFRYWNDAIFLPLLLLIYEKDKISALPLYWFFSVNFVQPLQVIYTKYFIVIKLVDNYSPFQVQMS